MRDVAGAYDVAERRGRDHSAAGRGALALLIGRRFIVSAGQSGYGVVSAPGPEPTCDKRRGVACRHMVA